MSPNSPPPDPDTTPELVRRVTGRGPDSSDAFGQLVRLHQAWVRGYLRARLRDWAAADDLAQDVFVTAFRRIDRYRVDATFESWLRGIAANLLRNHLRKRREEYVGGHEELQMLAAEAATAGEGAVSGPDRAAALQECLEKLDGPSRDLLRQRYTEGRSVRELAAASGRGYSALTMQLHRVREILARCIDHKAGSPA